MTAHDLRAPPRTYRLTIADYLALNDAGAFEDLRTELLEGEIFVVSPQSSRHFYIKSELGYRVRRALEGIGSSLFVGIDGSVAAPDTSMLEPDIVLTADILGENYVALRSVRLIIEVAITSRQFDLEQKAPAYARGGVPEYWVADANDGVIHRLWSPGPDGYAERDQVRFGERIESATIAGLIVETTGLV